MERLCQQTVFAISHTNTNAHPTTTKNNNRWWSEMKKQRPVNDKKTNVYYIFIDRMVLESDLIWVAFFSALLVCFYFSCRCSQKYFRFYGDLICYCCPTRLLLLVYFVCVRVCLFFRSVDFIGFTCTRTFPATVLGFLFCFAIWVRVFWVVEIEFPLAHRLKLGGDKEERDPQKMRY